MKGATWSSQVSKVILGPIQPKRPQGPSHPGNPEGLIIERNPRAKGPESHAMMQYNTRDAMWHGVT